MRKREIAVQKADQLQVGHAWFLFETPDGARVQIEGHRVGADEAGYFLIDGERQGLRLIEVRDA